MSQTDGNGFLTTYEYDNANRLTRLIDADLRTTRYGYTAGGRLNAVTDGVGNTTTYTHDSAGRVATEVAPKGRAPGADPAQFTTRYGYDFNGNLTTVSHPFPDGGTATVTYQYNSLNELVAAVDPLGHSLRYGYDAAGNVASVTDPLGLTTTATYDGNNRRTSVTDPRGKTTRFTYDAAGNLTAWTTPGGQKTTYRYDAADRLIATTSPRGNVEGADSAAFTSRASYDPAGQVISTTDALGNVSRMEYDPARRLSRLVDPNGQAIRYTYDNANRLTRILGPDATNDTQATVNNYDHVGHLIDRTDPRGFVQRRTYDAAGRLASTIDGIGNRREYTYDANGNLATVLTARGSSSGSPAGRAAGTIVLRYDNLDRLREWVPGTGAAYSYGYDGASHLTNLADPSGEQVRGFDAAGRLTRVTRGGTAFTYDYDAASNLVKRALPDGSSQTLGYDDDSRPVSLDSPVGRTTYSYDPDGGLIRTTLPGAGTDQRGYDNAGRLNALTITAPDGQPLTAYAVVRDKVGNPTRVDTTIAGTKTSDAFTYDAANRLSAACFRTTTCSGAANRLSFTYDLVGNRLTRTKTGAGGFTERYTYNAADQLTSRSGGPDGTVTYDYDADGNTVRAGNVRLTYGLDDRVTSVDNGQRRTAYTDDAAGNRLSAETRPSGGGAATTTAYQWDVNNPLPALAAEQTGADTRSYVYHPDSSPLSQQAGGVTSLLRPDPFGNTTTLTDTAGAVQRRYTLTDPFGELIPTMPAGPDTRLGFQGQYNDPLSGSYHLRARDYGTATGRFGSVDPLGKRLTRPVESAYSYANNNPLTGSDPSGLCWFDPVCTAGIAVRSGRCRTR